MNEEPTNENQSVPTPDFSGEEMKMPENATASVMTEEKSAASGVMILILGVLLLAILIGLFMWFSSLNKVSDAPTPATPIERPTDEENNEPESTTAEARTDAAATVSTSDEISAIEADLEATDFDALDAELNALDAEFNNL